MNTDLLKTAVDFIKNGQKLKGKEIIIELLKTLTKNIEKNLENSTKPNR